MKTENKVNKVAIARQVFAAVSAPDYDLGEVKSVRQAFISQAMSAADLTKHGASTYWQNLSNEARGKGLYKYNKVAKKAVEVEVQVEVQATEQHRWMVVGENNKEIASFESRAKAQAEAKATGMKWADRNKA